MTQATPRATPSPRARTKRAPAGSAAATAAAATAPAATHVGVLIIGSGFGGLGAAIRLAKDGRNDYLVLERAGEVGGTWRDNDYPGAACDVPSHLYSYSFELNPNWSRSFSPQAEIQDYIRDTARKYGVYDKVVFNAAVTNAAWDDAAGLWRVETTAGPYTATILVAATGPLAEPNLPDIKGIENFGGEIFHSARWNHDYDLTGKRVAVIGTGASAIQIVPAIAGKVAHLDVYQRTAPWIVPRHDRTYSKLESLAYKRIPGLQRVAREAIYWGRELYVLGFVYQPKVLQLAQRMAERNIAKGIKDPALRKKVTPGWQIGCKRILISNDWYPALARENVDVVTDGITEVRKNAVVTADGTVREVDAIIVCTGFYVTNSPTFDVIVGKDGLSLGETWRRGGQQGYKGSTVAGFPNLFFLVGPNCGLGHSSIVYMIESQLNYISNALELMDRHGLATFEVREDKQRAFNDNIQKQMKNTIWMTGGCSSWYLDEHGKNTTLWPNFTFVYRQMTRKFDLTAYRTTARDDRQAGTTTAVKKGAA